MQKFLAKVPHRFPNGAVGYAPGGKFDYIGPYAKVENCPIYVIENGKRIYTGLRRTCYGTGVADTMFSIPACGRYRDRYLGGFFTKDSYGGVMFIVADRYKNRLGRYSDTSRPEDTKGVRLT